MSESEEDIKKLAREALDDMTDQEKAAFKKEYEKGIKRKKSEELRKKKLKMSELFP